MSDLFDVIRFAFVVAVMVPACISDWKRREASDIYWAMMGMFGIVCMIHTSVTEGIRIEHIMMTAGTAMILMSILLDVERSKGITVLFYGSTAALFLIPSAMALDDILVRQFLAVPILSAVFLLMFRTGMIKGGADAKFLIVLAMVFQTYPEFMGLPLITIPSFEISLIFQFTLMVLFHAALIFILFPAIYGAINLKRRDTVFPAMLIGFRMSTEGAKDSFVWPLDKVIDGRIVTTGKAQDHGSVKELEDAGANTIWVTPMVPFLIPLAASFVFVSLVGNLLFLMF